jgi:hypothetical protein
VRASSAPTNAPAKNNRSNVIDLMDAKKSLGSLPKKSPQSTTSAQAKSKRSGAAKASKRA